MYEGVPKHRGSKFSFQKHFTGPDEIPAFDGKDSGEEELCAVAINSLGEIEFWSRNVSQHSNSFRLPLAGRSCFYPDFVAKLKDGRILVVEYKGQQHAGDQETKDTRKEDHRRPMAEASDGRGVFVLATMKHNDAGEIRKQIKEGLDG